MRRLVGFAAVGLVLGMAWMLVRWTGLDLLPPPSIADRRFSVAWPEDEELRLAVLGTSLSAGEPWPEVLADQLRASLGSPVSLSVFAQSGSGSDWGLTQASKVAAARPDLLLVEFAINDADLTDGSSLSKAAYTHAALVREIAENAPDTEIVLMTMSPAYGLRGLARPRLRAHYLQYRTLAEELQVGLIDLYPRWLALPREARGLSEDGLHPDPDIATRLIVPVAVEAVLCAVRSSGCGSV